MLVLLLTHPQRIATKKGALRPLIVTVIEFLTHNLSCTTNRLEAIHLLLGSLEDMLSRVYHRRFPQVLYTAVIAGIVGPLSAYLAKATEAKKDTKRWLLTQWGEDEDSESEVCAIHCLCLHLSRT